MIAMRAFFLIALIVVALALCEARRSNYGPNAALMWDKFKVNLSSLARRNGGLEVSSFLPASFQQAIL